MASNQINEDSNKLNTSIGAVDQMQMNKYNHTNVNGAEVINAIENYKDLCVIVKYPSNASQCMAFNRGIENNWDSSGIYSKASVPDTAALKDMYSALKISNRANEDNYINLSANFDAKLLKNGSGAIIGLTFSHTK